MGQLAVDQTHQVAPRGNSLRLIFSSSLMSDFGYLVRRNETANLAQEVGLASGVIKRTAVCASVSPTPVRAGSTSRIKDLFPTFPTYLRLFGRSWRSALRI